MSKFADVFFSTTWKVLLPVVTCSAGSSIFGEHDIYYRKCFAVFYCILNWMYRKQEAGKPFRMLDVCSRPTLAPIWRMG